MGTVLLRFLVGGIAGLLAWMVMEPSAPKSYPGVGWPEWEGTLILLVGAFTGCAIGGLNGFAQGGKRHTIRGLVLGLFLGAIGATFGHGLGGVLAQAIFGNLVFESGAFPVQVMARTVAFLPIGLFLGAAIGASSLTWKRTLQGAIGGAIGAAIGGLSFDIIVQITAIGQLRAQGLTSGEVGGPGRALTMMIVGAAIGLFIGLVDRLARSAWLRLTLGRNEGKEWSIDSAQTFIGRSESAHVPLFGDASVAPIHASIQKQGGQYMLIDGGSPVGTLVNGQRIQALPLFHGAAIQIGSFTLHFLMKNQQAPVRGPEAYPGQAYQIQPQPYQPVPAGGVPTSMSPAAGMPHGLTPHGSPTVAYPGPMQPSGTPTVAYPGPMQPSGAALVAVDGPLSGQRFPVQGPVDLGRESPTVPMGFDSNASRRHAQVTPTTGGVSVTDLGSTNGTFVNGQRIQSTVAKVGDMIKIGSTTFRVEAV